LGPEANRALGGPTLVSAADEAQSARDALSDALGLPLVGAPSPPREESVAFTLGDADFLSEDALPLPVLPDEEITRVTAPPEPSAPRAAPVPDGGPLGTARMQAMPLTPPPVAIAPPPPPVFVPPPPVTFGPASTAGMTALSAAPLGTLQSPSAPSYSGLEAVTRAPSSPPAPLLIDVTPLTLAVETVNGFCDAVIERNTQVPCERTRVFVTAVDRQTLVRVRISQGESSRFAENTLLGEVELSGLTPAPRGETQIAVSFSLDTNGMLSVSAKDVATNRATSTQVRLIALPEANEIAWMMQRNAARQ
jgi:molecular chaperone DnaK